MTNRARAALMLSFIMLVCPVARAQKAASIGQLREQIRKMLAVDASDATTPEVRNLNRELLRERRAQLRELLQQRLDALLKYRAELKDSMTPDLERSLRNSIADVMAEIEEASGGRGTSATARRSPRRARTAAAAAPVAADDSAEATFVDASASAADAAPSQQVEQEAPIISASKITSAETMQVTVSNNNPNLKLVEVFVNGTRAAEMKIPNAAGKKDVLVNVKFPEKTNTLYAIGFPEDRSYSVRSSIYTIERVEATAVVAGSGAGAGGKGGDGAEAKPTPTPGVIEVKEPKNNGIFYDASLLDLNFAVTNKSDVKDKDKRVKEVFISVLDDKGIPVRQEKHSVALSYNDEGEAIDMTADATTRLRIAKGKNEVRLFSGYEKGEPVNLTKVQVECRGERCGAPAVDDFSNSMNMRAIVGFEQAGASSADSKTDPFLDLFFFGPLRYGNTCKGQTRKLQKTTEKDADGKDITIYKVVGVENDPEGCYPTWSSWGNVRFSSIPQQVSAFGTFASNFVSPLAEGKLTELVQGFNFIAGIDRYLGSTDRSFLSPVPGFRHRTAVYLTVGGGATSTLTPQRSAQVFKIPGENNPQRQDFIDEFFGEGGNIGNAEYIAFVAPERNKFLRQYYVGFRFKTHFIDRDGYTINRFPSILDVTFGQNEAVTGGKSRGVVSRIEGFLPFPLRQANFLYFYGSAFLKLGGKDEIKKPYILETPGSEIRLTDNNVHITTRQYDRDFYRIGIGVNLTELFNRGSSPPR